MEFSFSKFEFGHKVVIDIRNCSNFFLESLFIIRATYHKEEKYLNFIASYSGSIWSISGGAYTLKSHRKFKIDGGTCSQCPISKKFHL